jgi:hypothetical protein
MSSVIYESRHQGKRAAKDIMRVYSDMITKALHADDSKQYGESAAYWNRAATFAPTFELQGACRINAILMIDKLDNPPSNGIETEWGEVIDYANTPLPGYGDPCEGRR